MDQCEKVYSRTKQAHVLKLGTGREARPAVRRRTFSGTAETECLSQAQMCGVRVPFGCEAEPAISCGHSTCCSFLIIEKMYFSVALLASLDVRLSYASA